MIAGFITDRRAVNNVITGTTSFKSIAARRRARRGRPGLVGTAARDAHRCPSAADYTLIIHAKVSLYY